jgi:uncharacterized protein YbjQ (UPF0145 family)
MAETFAGHELVITPDPGCAHMFSSVRDVVGGRAGGYERALSGARDAALEDMMEAAKELGANGIVGIDFDYEVLGEANGMMMVTVSGTAVKMA